MNKSIYKKIEKSREKIERKGFLIKMNHKIDKIYNRYPYISSIYNHALPIFSNDDFNLCNGQFSMYN